jgi:GT2 family glycosyltransferase
MLIDRRKAFKIGLFDEDFVFGWEDGDFTFRMTLAGYPCLAVSRAHVYHRTETKGIRWIRYQVRNRWWFILKNYNFRTLIVTLPAILIYQFFTFGFFLIKGKGFEYLRGILDVIWSLPKVFIKHRQVMKIKRAKDKDVLLGKGMDMIGDAGSIFMVRFLTRLLNGFFSIYWFFTRPWVK